MRSRRHLHQFLPSLGFRDAVGNHTVSTAAALARAGYPGGIFAEHVHPEMVKRGKPYYRYESRRAGRRNRNAILYQASTGSDALVDFIVERPEPKAIYYHNITPAHFFEPYDPAAALNLARGRDELKRLASQARVALANSRYSALELESLGVAEAAVVPPYLPRSLDTPPSQSLASWIRRTKKSFDIVFVSRVVPNKGHLHLLRAFAALRAAVDPDARLFVVGAWGPEGYMQTIFRLRERLGLDGLAFTGSITESHLVALYQECDVFLCLSEHEGFGLPLVEAMRKGLPVIAYDAAAVGETIGGSGVLLRTLDPPVVAEVVGRVARDEALRHKLVEGQRRRVDEIEGFDRDGALARVARTLLG